MSCIVLHNVATTLRLDEPDEPDEPDPEPEPEPESDSDDSDDEFDGNAALHCRLTRDRMVNRYFRR